jgi:hypothetical protein
VVSLHSGTPLGVGTCHGHLDTPDSPRPGLGSKPPPYSPIVYSAFARESGIWMSLFPGTPEMESRSCPKCVPVGLLRLWTTITPRLDLASGWSLNQYCSPCQDLFNDVLHSPSARRERVDSRLLMVMSQTTSLTPGPSFAHNLGCICPNDQCEAIFNIYVSRPFQWHQKHPNARCFGPCYRTLNIRESRRTPHLGVLGFTPTLGPK